MRSFPLQFMMGEGDLYDSTRPIPVTAPEWAQHMLRYARGTLVKDLQGQRVVWAIVNHVLLQEARGKGFVVHQNVMRRIGNVGGRVVGRAPLQRSQLLRIMDDTSEMRALIH